VRWWLLAVVALVPLIVWGQGQQLFGKWMGERPTDGYVWQFKYQFELIPGSEGGANYGVPHRYKYTVKQLSTKRPFWTMTQTGTFTLKPTDSSQWKIMMEFRPDPGSQAPPTEADRTALVDVLGLPDDRVRLYRVRNSQGRLYFQLSDAPPADGIEQVWYLEPTR